jgi:hypothetical protein
MQTPNDATNNMPVIKTNKKPILVGIIGEIGVGKSLVASYLINKFNFHEYYFSKPIKDIAINMGFTHNQVYGTQENKLEINKYWGVSGREFLQKFGTDIGRNMLPSALPSMNMGSSGSPWIRLFEIYWEKMIEADDVRALVVSDCRYPDEL